ncbi:hypothetical protein GCM10010277_09740 [Streptomyces longisporoflavus]|nr:hypothetical protein GCM10010277_09740 [Streptomyces longisporoflavus]
MRMPVPPVAGPAVPGVYPADGAGDAGRAPDIVVGNAARTDRGPKGRGNPRRSSTAHWGMRLPQGL